MAAVQSEFMAETDREIFFHFRCECEHCGAEGELSLLKSEGHKPFGCPQGCGATYVPWKHLGHWRLTCVVLPFRYRYE